MTGDALEVRLIDLTRKVDDLVERDRVRQREDRRIARIATWTSIFCSLVAAGFLVGNAVFRSQITGARSDQFLMVGVIFMFISIPLMLLSQALRVRRPL